RRRARPVRLLETLEDARGGRLGAFAEAGSFELLLEKIGAGFVGELVVDLVGDLGFGLVAPQALERRLGVAQGAGILADRRDPLGAQAADRLGGLRGAPPALELGEPPLAVAHQRAQPCALARKAG